MSVAPYGSWKSPISSDLIVSSSIRLGSAAIDNGNIYWNEGRPTEGGRNLLMRYDNAGNSAENYRELTPAGLNVRSQVHEYGGGEYLVQDGRIYFTNFSDRCIYRQIGDNAPQPLTAVNDYRYADFAWSRDYGKLICVREDHTGGGEPVNTIVAVNTSNGEDIQVLVNGADFYASPRLNPDGNKLAWICWHHPNMPWDGTELWVGDLVESEIGVLAIANPRLIAGGVNESIFQPAWSPSGELYFVSDRTGWWNLYRTDLTNLDAIQPLCPMEAEFGLPQWVFGMSTYGFTGDGKILCTYTQQGISHLAILDPSNLEVGLQEITTPFTSISGIHCKGDQAVFHGGSATAPTAIVLLDVTTKAWQKIRVASDLQLDPEYISAAQPLEFPTENGKTAYGLFYAPKNKDFQAEATEKPPLLVKSHGGPTASTSGSLSLGIQYWTSRGFAVLDVNYGGSTGYGREYRDRLKGNWGIVDVDDCANGAKFLADQGLVDENRLAISGGSAGGYTTLCALTFRDDFKAGASHYGICDLEALATDTHKFESRYLDSLIGKYPEHKEIYIQRSPIHFTDKLSCAIAFFQGLEDKVVPPNQAEMMVDALRQKGLPVAYVPFEGEQHGFRKSENIKRALDGEFYFYAQIFGFTTADAIEPIAIENHTNT
ncbi:S9 family peptidase [Pseudanabaena mucicola]|uniref:S9 family peptidase n=1 Tax=Pseudanabaena mucicola FACHB-723 TaxID=2692860 RepID=A0ABR7ZXR4_9CYAN|nr:prolyl oligopeptidase family serine peptidase [Pseudanabaena mucicola]MBD2188584.1 S9 family peptidase [Pseudanabaena mucicola FACHB-723]